MPTENKRSFQLDFCLFGVPFQIQPFFWLAAILFSPFIQREFSDLRFLSCQLAGWLAAWFLTFAVHELGHALVIKKLFGGKPLIVLYGLGGVTIHQPVYRRRPGYWGHVLISFAGPAAVLSVIGVLIGAFALRGGEIALLPASFIGPIPIPVPWPRLGPLHPELLEAASNAFLFGFLWMGIVWSALNLLPIHPLDGGQIARYLLMKVHPRGGLRFSLILSIACAAAFILLAVTSGDYFISIFFGFFAMRNFSELKSLDARWG
ncbi:MAG: hypothetical protein IIZ25_02425 [Thermoguttaceae bacterium]|nr:hypothetical protein [Thermoguttaceae bacterium]